MLVCLLSGEVHLRQHRAVLRGERPAYSDTEGQEERNATALQRPDRGPVRRRPDVDGGNGRREETFKLPDVFLSHGNDSLDRKHHV